MSPKVTKTPVDTGAKVETAGVSWPGLTGGKASWDTSSPVCPQPLPPPAGQHQTSLGQGAPAAAEPWGLGKAGCPAGTPQERLQSAKRAWGPGLASARCTVGSRRAATGPDPHDHPPGAGSLCVRGRRAGRVTHTPGFTRSCRRGGLASSSSGPLLGALCVRPGGAAMPPPCTCRADMAAPSPAAQVSTVGALSPWQGGRQGSPRTRASGAQASSSATRGFPLHFQGFTFARPTPQEAPRSRPCGWRVPSCRSGSRCDSPRAWNDLVCRDGRRWVAVEEAGSLVSRDRDQGLLWRPRNVHILHDKSRPSLCVRLRGRWAPSPRSPAA